MGGPKSHHIHWILFHSWHRVVDGAAGSKCRGEGVCVSLGWLLPYMEFLIQQTFMYTLYTYTSLIPEPSLPPFYKFIYAHI